MSEPKPDAREKLEEAVKLTKDLHDAFCYEGCPWEAHAGRMVTFVDAALSDARRDEAEECAKVAERVPLDAGSIAARTQEAIASAIRARHPEPPTERKEPTDAE